MKKKWSLSFACLNLQGKVRRNNEDNFFAMGQYRRAEVTEDLSFRGELAAGSGELLAIYDGMGGEACGEVASLIASEESAAFSLGDRPAEQALQELCLTANRRICNYSRERGLGYMGTTAAMMLLGKDGIYFCNLGDSRIYKGNSRGLEQLSEDHVLRNYPKRKAPLTQHLGIPEEELLLEPYIRMEPYCAYDRFLLCSDGLTDMLSDEEISAVLLREQTVEQCARELGELAMERGGVDNTSLILCSVQEVPGFWTRLRRRFFPKRPQKDEVSL